MDVMSPPEVTNDETPLIFAAQGGDHTAFGKLVDLHKEGVLVFLTVRMFDRSEAEDLAQETFLTAWKRLQGFDPESAMGPWLRGIAHNLLRNHWRKHRAQPVGGSEELEALLHSNEGEYSAVWDGREDALQALRSCIGKLAPASRKLIRDRYEAGISIEEIATNAGRKHSATSMNLYRLRATLKTCIEKQTGIFTS